MRSLISPLLAAMVAYWVNAVVVNRWGRRAIILATPIIEEAAKTGFAIVVGSSLVFTHLGFGLVEAINDWREGAKSLRLGAGLLSLAGHAAFGWLTDHVAKETGFLVIGWLAAVLVHILWNLLVLGRWLAE